MDLCLEPGAQVGELETKAHHLTELSDLGRGDPGLCQAPEAQQVGEIPGIALVVLHPPVPPIVALRVGQMDRIAHLFEQIDGPIPAIGRFDDDVAANRGCAHLLGEGHGLIFHPSRTDLLSVFVHPVDDRTPAVQVNADILLCHRGLPFREVFV